jgi:predicted acylesterase/phospholipase RssA
MPEPARLLTTLTAVALALAACSTLPERRPAPPEIAAIATVPGLPSHARFLGDQAPADVVARVDATRRGGAEAWRGRQHFLALSGGGPFGAFGAGLLVGWTRHGDRPEFTIVTGISAGALIAPFAFLGPDYDDELTDVFTRFSTGDLVVRRGLIGILTGDSVADTSPMLALIAQHLDAVAIERMAAEHRRGRQLWIGTTNLDMARPVIWDVTAIAASDRPDRAELIHKITLASASIPGAFPPVYFDVEADGRAFDELHVDGGITSPVFLYPGALRFGQVLRGLGVRDRPKVFVVANMPLVPYVDPVEPPSILQIATRSTLALIRSQTIGSLYSIYLGAQRDGLDFNLSYIPADFRERPVEPFDPTFMGALFERGRAIGEAGIPWLKTPVDLAPGDPEPPPGGTAPAPLPAPAPVAAR